MLGSSTKSTSTSRRLFLAPEFDSSTASPARQSSLATRRRSGASALHTCATQYARRSRTPHPFSPAGELQLGETFTREGGNAEVAALTAYLTAYPWQSVTRQDTLWHKRGKPPSTGGTA